MKKKSFAVFIIILIILFLILALQHVQNRKIKNVNLNIGYQSITAQTWSALIMKRLHLIEKYYGQGKLNVSWSNFASGPPITSNMIGGKLDIGFMGDMPLLINGDFGQNNKHYDSQLIMFDGKGLDGINQDIIVKNNSNINKPEDLSGKKVSVPNSSSAHRHLMQELSLAEINSSLVNISFQDIPTAVTLLEKGDIDAIVVWEPYSTYLTIEKDYKPITKTSKNRYLAGVVANDQFIKNNPDIYKAFELALIEAHQLLNSKSPEIIKIVSEESGFSEKVVAKTIQNITWDETITADDLSALEEDVIFLKNINKISNSFNLNDFVKTKK
jgi:NitT/TauT family transport system substrate-binding protein